MPKLYAFDLITKDNYRELWCFDSRSDSFMNESKNLPKGFSTPMGFWISASNKFPTGQIYEITISEPDDIAAKNRVKKLPNSITTKFGSNAVQTALDGDHALILAKKAVWDKVSPVLLLCLTQYWRCEWLHRQLNVLSQFARSNLSYASLPALFKPKKIKNIVTHDQLYRALAQDLPYFKGPLITPNQYCHTQSMVDIYQAFTEKLKINDWFTQIELRLETVSLVYDVIIEKYMHHKATCYEVGLETIIILILLLDLYLLYLCP